jgi:dihydrolipoamide dehydrogenase
MHDIIVIGGGPAGYVAAIRAAQLGFDVACVEKRSTLGGTCLNVGCIPSKALLQSSHKYHEAKHALDVHGVDTSNVILNLEKMMQRKSNVVADLTKGIAFLFKKNKVKHYQGVASFIDHNTLNIVAENGDNQQIQGKNIIIATGSVSANIANVNVDEVDIVSSTGALSFTKVPDHLVVIGGGYIGLELGSVWNALGTKVTVVEFADSIIPAMDHDIAKEMLKVLKKQGLEFNLQTKVTSVNKRGDNTLEINIEAANGGNTQVIEADKVLVCVGRLPNTQGLALDKVGVSVEPKGTITVNDKFQTNISNIYAIGDVIKGAMLAHKAEEEAVVCVEMLAGQSGHIDYNCIPGVVYTHPEVASVGKSEQQLKQDGIAYAVGSFPFMANSRARTSGESDGFVKILADKQTGVILGAHIIGPEAGTLIAELVLAMEFKATAEDVYRTCHAHPALNEAVKEAALAVDNRAIHV